MISKKLLNAVGLDEKEEWKLDTIKFSEFGTGDTRLCIDSGISTDDNNQSEVLCWVQDEENDEVEGSTMYVTENDARAIVELFGELFGWVK